jgi:hypothetical protein
MGRGFRYSPGIRVYGLMKTMEPQDTKCTGPVTCTSEMGHAAPIRENIKAHRIVVGKTERKKPPGISRCKWGANIKIHFKEIKLVRVDWIHLAQNRDKWRVFVNTVMNLRLYKMWGIS